MSKVSRKLKQKMDALSDILSEGFEPEAVAYADDRRKLARKSKLIKVKKKSVILVDEEGSTVAHLTLADGKISVKTADHIKLIEPSDKTARPRKQRQARSAFQGGGHSPGDGPDLTRKEKVEKTEVPQPTVPAAT